MVRNRATPSVGIHGIGVYRGTLQMYEILRIDPGKLGKQSVEDDKKTNCDSDLKASFHICKVFLWRREAFKL